MKKAARVDHAQCPGAATHTPSPSGYVEWSDWAHQQSKTHRQILCAGCGLYLVWVPKEAAIQSATGAK